MSYKITNHESVILRDMTIEKEGNDPDKLLPKSNKFIWVVCRYCGEPNRTKKSKYTISGNSNCHRLCRYKELKEVKSTFARDDVKAKIKSTMMERYGVPHCSLNSDTIEKRKKTFRKRFGVDNPSQSEEIKQKKRDTCMKNHGVKYPLQNAEILAKAEKTLQNRLGVSHPSQSEQVKEKMKESFINNFCGDNPTKDEAIKERARKGFALHMEEDPNGKFELFNALKDKEHPIWEKLKTLSLSKIASINDIEYDKLRAALYDNKDYRSKFLETYVYPRIQQQKSVEKQISSFLLPDFKVISGDRKQIKPLELDIYVPDKNFAIEFNGSYWHSEAHLDRKEARTKQVKKTRMCREKNIRLFHIFEHQWIKRQPQIMGFLRSVLGANENKIAARKCKMTNTPCPDFMNANHIQGKTHSALRWFNLEYEGRIVASMTASRHHRQNAGSKDVVLSRLCFDSNTTVQGGASKLFKAFIGWTRGQGCDRIVSWSDSSWTDGGIYPILGFEFEKEYDPDYFYWDRGEDCYRSKQSQKKKAVGCPDGLTEREWCLQRGLFRIWNCGKKLWIYNLKEN